MFKFYATLSNKLLCFLIKQIAIVYLIVGTDAETNNHDASAPDLVSCPPVPPRKHRRRHTPPRPPSNGLPPTPKVHMGACFSKVSISYTSTVRFLKDGWSQECNIS